MTFLTSAHRSAERNTPFGGGEADLDRHGWGLRKCDEPDLFCVGAAAYLEVLLRRGCCDSVVVTATLVRAHSAAIVSLKVTTKVGKGSAHPTGIVKRVGSAVAVMTLRNS